MFLIYSSFSRYIPSPDDLGLISEELFNINKHFNSCGPMPGPGNTKARKLLFNPMRAYFDSSRRLYDDHFDEFKSDHNKKYDTQFEEEQRRKNFLDNSRFIGAINRRKPNYRLGVNHLTDKSEEELQILRGRRVTLLKDNGGLPFKSNRLYGRENDNEALPANWDWRL